MDIRYQIYEKLNLYVAKCSGDVTFQDIATHVDKLMNDKQYYVGINAIYDFTQVAHLHGEVATFEQLANRMSDQKVIPKVATTAIIINDEATAVRAMMEGYLLMTSASNIDYQIFNQYQLASAKLHVHLPNSFDLTSIGVCDHLPSCVD
jgi:hypothetical protein